MIEELKRLVESIKGSEEYKSRDFKKVVDMLDSLVQHTENLENRICDLEYSSIPDEEKYIQQ
jgi:hypothetical protein